MASVVVDHVSKAFRRREGRSLKELLVQGLRRREELQVLRDVSFSVEKGEWVALIGSNGSGKSTLFRLISGIYPPDRGAIRVDGRIAPLIELTAGFHPDLTGDENLVLNAAILGLTPEEFAARRDAIVRYAGLEDFMATPVRYYSSGMMSRLGFALTVHVDADVLLIDEVLAVGDESFQKQCIETLRQQHRAGTTIVFVSHDLHAVERETQRTLWLEKGILRMDGVSAEVVRAYREGQGTLHAAG